MVISSFSYSIGCYILRTNVASVGSVFNDTRKVKVLSLPETIKQNSTFRTKALRRLLTPDEGPSLETSNFALSFQVVREPLPFVLHIESIRNIYQARILWVGIFSLSYNLVGNPSPAYIVLVGKVQHRCVKITRE